MAQHDARIIAVVGATGLQGGAVTRRLLTDHWPVRALTRNPEGHKARALAQLGAEVVKADTSDPVSLERAFDGVHGVFSMQNHHLSGYEGEVQQGKQVAEVAQRVGVSQVWIPTTRAAGVEGLRFHDLRHTAATLAVAAGASTRKLMVRMGHSSSAAALRYQHVMAGRDAAIAAALDELIQATSAVSGKLSQAASKRRKSR